MSHWYAYAYHAYQAVIAEVVGKKTPGNPQKYNIFSEHIKKQKTEVWLLKVVNRQLYYPPKKPKDIYPFSPLYVFQSQGFYADNYFY